MSMITSIQRTAARTSTKLATLAMLVGAPAFAHASDWDIDPAHSSAQFSVRHMMVSTVRGRFEKVSGTVNLDDKDATKSAVEVKIDPASINTGVTARDNHLKSPDFFDVAKNPAITFKSTKIDKAGKGKFKVLGDLTMHGVTKPVTLTVEGPTPEVKGMAGPVRGFSASGKLNRKDWGLGWNKALEAGGVAIGEEVTLQIDGELSPHAAAAAAAAPAAAKPATATK